ncbi:MAG: hypothetical protein QM783_01205 [Phycisphaerales bacterium]
MKKIVMLAVLAGSASVAMADDLIFIDLSVANQVTVTANAAGLSSAAATGGTGTGILLANFWTGTGTVTGTFSNGVGGFRSVLGSAGDNSPSLYRFGTTETGLNIWSFATTATFAVGQQAFSSSFVATLTPAAYTEMLANAGSGNIYFQADDSSDIPTAVVLGTWRVVPTPGAAAVLGLGGLALGRRRRA